MRTNGLWLCGWPRLSRSRSWLQMPARRIFRRGREPSVVHRDGRVAKHPMLLAPSVRPAFGLPRPFTEVLMPRRLVIRGNFDTAPVTIAVATPQTDFEIALTRGSDPLPGDAVFEAHPPLTRVRIGVPVSTALFRGWDHYTWVVTAHTGDRGTSAVLPVEVRQGSTFQYEALRSGSHVRVVASVDRYDAATDRVVAWLGHPVTVQRWTPHGWTTIRRVRTDPAGGVDTTFAIAWKVGLRVTVPGTATTWAPATHSTSA